MRDGMKASTICITLLLPSILYSSGKANAGGIFCFSLELEGVVGDDFFY